MRRMLTLPRMLLAGAAALVMVAAPAGLASPATASETTADESSSQERFDAHYRDRCVAAHTSGVVTWPQFGVRPTVQVQGHLAQEYVCAEVDLQVTFADFRAFAGNQLVDFRTEIVGHNSAVRYGFEMQNATSFQQISRVEVRVCHDTPFTPRPPSPPPAWNCGEPAFVFPPAQIPPPQPPPVPEAA